MTTGHSDVKVDSFDRPHKCNIGHSIYLADSYQDYKVRASG